MDKSKNTIYLRDLPDNISKDQLKQSLYELATEFGVVLDIVALKTDKMRGQAFVVFRDESSAASALQGMNGFSFYGKRIVAQYARRPSNATLVAGAAAIAAATG